MNHSRGLVVGLLFSVSCGPADRTEESLASDSAPITGGRLVPADQHGAPDTSAIKIQWTASNGGVVACSGAKVGTNVYWTAGHCAENWSVGTTLSITNNLTGQFSGSSSYTRTVASVDVHGSRKNANAMFPFTSPRQHDHYDVARFTLNATTPNIPIYSTTDSAWVEPNQSVTYTGYGCDMADSTHSGQKQYAFFNLVTSSAFQSIGLKPSYYIHNMGDTRLTPQGCDGDSGSPVWKKFGSTWKQIGIAVHGELGYTGLARYSNVRNWLAAPALNDIRLGSQGFLLNQWTGRCISKGVSLAFDDTCDGRDQSLDNQSFILAASGFTSDSFLLQGGLHRESCLGVDFSVSPPQVAVQACSTQGLVNYQRWRFDAISGQPNYRKLYNPTANLCAAPSDTASFNDGVNGDRIVLVPCSNVHPNWRYQAWMLTP
jgi:V8-like Glu-specific endopeptidase